MVAPAPENKTIELESADLIQSGQSGELAYRTRELRQAQTPRATVVVDLTPVKPAVVPRGTAELRVSPRRGGLGLVILVYVIATAALAISIYTRFFT